MPFLYPSQPIKACTQFGDAKGMQDDLGDYITVCDGRMVHHAARPTVTFVAKRHCQCPFVAKKL